MLFRPPLTTLTATMGAIVAALAVTMLACGEIVPGLLLAAATGLLGLALVWLLRSKQRHLNAVMSSIAEGILVYDRGRRLVAWNGNACALAGIDPAFPRPGMAHHAVLRHMHARGELGEERSAEAIIAEFDKRPPSYEGVRRRPNGRHVRVRRSPTPDGGRVVVITDVTDITLAEEWLNATNDELEQRVQERVAELDRAVQTMQDEIARRQEAEEWLLQLNAQNDLLAAVIEADASGVLIVDSTQSPAPVIYCNEAFVQMTGYSREEVIGQVPSFLVGPDTDPEMRKRVREAVAKGVSSVVEVLHYRKGGEPFWNHLSMFPVRGKDGRIRHYVGSMTDVTQRRQAQDESARLQAQMTEMSKFEALGTLAGGVAHEINTPIQYVGDNIRFLQSGFADMLGVIDGYTAAAAGDAAATAQLAQRLAAADLDFLRGEVPTAIGQCLDGIGRVSQIVQAIKEFSHPSGKQAVPFDLNHAVETAVTVSRNQWKYVAEVALDLDPALPPVTGNQGEINQVLLNMIVNAAHAIEEAGRGAPGQISITTRHVGDLAELSIRDSGVGIGKDKLQKIFEMFYTTKPPGKGTGQGLAICRTIIVQRHGGDVAVESEPGIGTCFRITLPIDGASQAKAA
jgi:PAS domain S-box-containing protein